MGRAIGAGAYAAFDEETTEGTGVTPTKKHRIRSFDVSRAPRLEVVEPLDDGDGSVPNPSAMFSSAVESGGNYSFNAYYDSNLTLMTMKHGYGSVVAAGSGPYTYTFNVTKAQPTKPSMTMEFVRGQGGPTASAEVYNGCRIAKLVRSVETGGTVQYSADFIAQTADDRSAPTTGLSYEPSRKLAYHADVTSLVFNSLTISDVMAATLTIDKKLARTPVLGSLVTGAPLMDGLAEVTLDITIRYSTNALQQALIAGAVAAGTLTTTNGAESIVDSFPALRVVSVSDPVSGAGVITQAVSFRALSTNSAGPVSTVVTNAVSP